MLIRRMGEQKAIVFSTHILEEVDAACTRAIIIDRGKIVANGTPRELRQRSDFAGAVTIRLQGVAGDAARELIRSLAPVRKCTVEEEANGSVLLRAFPQARSQEGEVELAVSQLAVSEQWRLSQLKTEEGRLDEVFRHITLPDTTRRPDKE